MAVANSTGRDTPDFLARHMVRCALKGALATLEAETGAPYASMVLLASDADGAPVTLISQLALHTRNLLRSSKASLLIDTSNAAGDAASGGRISLMGQLISVPAAAVQARFLARHVLAAGYVGFADFGFYRFDVATAHFIEGFGRILPLPGKALRPPIADTSALAALEPELLDLFRQRWPSVTGIDCEGVDLVRAGGAERLTFSEPAATVDAARDAAERCLEKYCAAQ